MRREPWGGVRTWRMGAGLALWVMVGGIWLGGRACLASGWETTQGLLAGSIDQVRAKDIDTKSWNAQLTVEMQKSVWSQHRVIVDANWDYGKVRDNEARTESVYPDLVDLEVKLLREAKPPFAFFVGANYLSEHDLKPGIVGLGLGYRAEILGNLTVDLSFQGTKDITSGLEPQAGYRLGVTYRQPLIRNLEVWIDGRTQRGFGSEATRQEYVEARALYELGGRMRLTYVQRLEDPLLYETFRMTTHLLLGYDLR